MERNAIVAGQKIALKIVAGLKELNFQTMKSHALSGPPKSVAQLR